MRLSEVDFFDDLLYGDDNQALATGVSLVSVSEVVSCTVDCSHGLGFVLTD
jgi:hypothetical protein